MGNTARADRIIEQTLTSIADGTTTPLEEGYTRVVTYEDLAIHFAQLSDVDRALEWAALAYQQSPVGIEIRVLESALFRPVREEPEFNERIAELRAGIYERVRRRSSASTPRRYRPPEAGK